MQTFNPQTTTFNTFDQSTLLGLLKPVQKKISQYTDASIETDITFQKPERKCRAKATKKSQLNQKKNTKVYKKEHIKDLTKKACQPQNKKSFNSSLIKETMTPNTEASLSPIIPQKFVPYIKSKPISKVTQKPLIVSPELKMFLSLQKVRPAVKPITLSLANKAKRDAIKAKLSEKPKPKTLMISIPLQNEIVQNEAPHKSEQAVDYRKNEENVRSPNTNQTTPIHQNQNVAQIEQNGQQAVNNLLQELVNQQITSLISQLPQIQSPQVIPQQIQNSGFGVQTSNDCEQNINSILNALIPNQIQGQNIIQNEPQGQEIEQIIQLLMSQRQ